MQERRVGRAEGLGRGQRQIAARIPLVGSSRLVGAVVFQAGRDADQIVVPRDALLKDQFLLAGQAKAGGPVRRQFAVERDFLQQRVLVVGLQALFDGIQVELQVAGRASGNRASGTARRPGSPDWTTASPPSLVRRRQVQLFRVAEQVPVMPGGVEIDAQIGRVADTEVHRVQRPLGQVEIDRQLPLAFERRRRFHAHHRKNADRKTDPAAPFRSPAG